MAASFTTISPRPLPDLSAEPAPTFDYDAWPAEGGEMSVRFRGELDIAAVERVGRSLSDAFARAEAVRVDLRQVSFMDGAGLGALVGARARAGASGRRLTLVRNEGQFDVLLRIAGFDDLFQTAAADPPLRARRLSAVAGTTRLQCPRCGLTIEARPAGGTQVDCPRCLGRSQLSIPMAAVRDRVVTRCR